MKLSRNILQRKGNFHLYIVYLLNKYKITVDNLLTEDNILNDYSKLYILFLTLICLPF